MATVTLAESAKLAQEQLVSGLIENIVTSDAFFDILPFDGIDGNALSYNRENVLGAVATVGIGNTEGVIGPDASGGANLAERQAAKDAATFTKVTTSLTTIMGDAEVNGLIQATRSNRGNDQTAIQIGSKAKSAGRKYQDMLINGDGTNNQFTGLMSLVPAGQKTTPSTNGDALSFEHLDELMDLVKDKNGQVDYFQMTSRTRRKLFALLRAQGGSSSDDVMELPSGRQVPVYRGVPIFVNDNIPMDQTQGSSTNATTVFAGTLDDGSQSMGITGLTAANASGLEVDDLGISATKDEHMWRVKWYCGLALFSELGIASAGGIIP